MGASHSAPPSVDSSSHQGSAEDAAGVQHRLQQAQDQKDESTKGAQPKAQEKKATQKDRDTGAKGNPGSAASKAAGTPAAPGPGRDEPPPPCLGST